jgi:hypothetical protein
MDKPFSFQSFEDIVELALAQSPDATKFLLVLKMGQQVISMLWLGSDQSQDGVIWQ